MNASIMHRSDRIGSKARFLLPIHWMLVATLLVLVPMSAPKAADHGRPQASHGRQAPAHGDRRDDRDHDRGGYGSYGAPPLVYAPDQPSGVNLFLSL